MTSHQFVFPPPPPPPPPQTQSSYHNPAGPHNLWNNGRGNRSDHRRGQSGFSRGSRGGLRGGARGGLRGGPRGGSRGGSHCLYHTGFDSRPTNSPGHSHPLPQYPLGQQFHYLAAPQNHVHPTLAYSPAPGVDVGVEYHDDTQRQVQFYSVQQDGTSYKYNFPNQNAPYDPQQAPQYVPVAPLQDNQYPTLIRGPPIRMGFGANDYTAGDQHVQAQHQIQPHPISSGVHHLQHGPGSIMPSSFRAVSQTPLNITRYDSPNPFPDQRTCGQKRQHDGIAGQRRHKNKTSAEVKTKVAPAVPSFGKPLPVSLPPSQETEERPKRKKRRHNQLGLTPKSLEYESSEDENDVDEEVKLANAAGLPSSDRLQFSYKGRTSTLQSFADIAAWIQERKNRFPTKARVEKQKENQRQLKTSQQAKRQALKESTKPKQLAKPVEKQKQTTEVKEEAESKDGEMECAVTAEAAKSKAKLEKLRKELRKQEKRIAKAEAKASRLDSEANKYQPGGLVPPIATGATIIKRSDGDRPDKELQEIKLEVVSQATFTAPTSAPHEDCSSNKAGGNDGGTDNRIESTENEDSKPNNIKVPIDISPEVPLDTSKLTSEKADDKSTREKAIAENHDIKLEDVELPIEPCTLSLQVGSSSTKNGEEAGSGVDNSILKEDNASAASIINPLTPISQPSPICKEGELHSEQNAQPHEITSALPSAQPASDPQDYILFRFDNRSISSIDSLSTTDSEDDITSSSGSSSSSSSSSTPEAQPVRRALAEREPPIKRRQNQQAKNICHSFFNNRGFCRKGQRCRYRHELPEGRTIGQSTKKNNSIREQGGKNQRISLYQRLVDQEVKQEQDEKRQKEESAPIKKEEGN